MNNAFLHQAFIVLLLFVPAIAQAHDTDFLRSTGKIYAVVAVLAVILAGIVVYLWRLEKKVKNLEEKIK